MEQRRTRRFALQLPLSVTRSGTERVMHPGLTKNISSGGVLFSADQEAGVGTSIEYVINLGGAPEQNICLRCIGKVLRSNRADSAETAYEIAATLERYEFVRVDE